MNLKINVFATQNNELRTITVNASTWGELHRALEQGEYSSEDGVQSYNLSDCTCKVKETKLAFDNGTAGKGAALPTGKGEDGVDFTLFIVPQKIKSGNYVTNEHLMVELQNLRKMFESVFAELEESSNEMVMKDNSKEALRAKLAKEAAEFNY